MTGNDLWLLVFATVLVLLAGLFSAAEAALAGFSRARAEEREAIGALDRVHAEVGDQPLGHRVTLGYPQCDVVNGPGRHRRSA